jgi:ribosome assembly protein YihI (activator of Der GTPase)
MGREVHPDLAAEISSLEEDERINDELDRLKAQMGASADTK